MFYCQDVLGSHPNSTCSGPNDRKAELLRGQGLYARNSKTFAARENGMQACLSRHLQQRCLSPSTVFCSFHALHHPNLIVMSIFASWAAHAEDYSQESKFGDLFGQSGSRVEQDFTSYKAHVEVGKGQ